MDHMSDAYWTAFWGMVGMVAATLIAQLCSLILGILNKRSIAAARAESATKEGLKKAVEETHEKLEQVPKETVRQINGGLAKLDTVVKADDRAVEAQREAAAAREAARDAKEAELRHNQAQKEQVQALQVSHAELKAMMAKVLEEMAKKKEG
jgi:enoyl-[acyl-carrier-protein] reductase (NADH)